MNRKSIFRVLAIILCIVPFVAAFITQQGAKPDVNPFYQTAWALLPPVIAIVLALITK